MALTEMLSLYVLINKINVEGVHNMKNVKELKAAILKIEKKNKAHKIAIRAFGKLHASFGFTYLD